MSFAVKSVVRAKVSGYESSDDKAVDLSFTHSVVTDFSSGTGSGKANEAWNDTRTVSSGSSEDLDLAGGLVRGGYTYTFTKVKGIIIKASSDNTTDVGVTPAAANGWTGPFADASDKLVIPPGGMVVLIHATTGWTVTAGTGDLLTISDEGAAGVSYDITVFGEGSKA